MRATAKYFWPRWFLAQILCGCHHSALPGRKGNKAYGFALSDCIPYSLSLAAGGAAFAVAWLGAPRSAGVEWP